MTRKRKPAVFGFVDAQGKASDQVPALCLNSAFAKAGENGFETIGTLAGRATIVVRPEAGQLIAQEGQVSFEIDGAVPGMRAVIAEYPCVISLDSGINVAVSATGIIGNPAKPSKKAGMSL